MMAQVSPVAGGVAALVPGTGNCPRGVPWGTTDVRNSWELNPCEAPVVVQATLRSWEAPTRLMYGRCSRCPACVRAGRARAFVRLSRRVERIVAAGMAVTGLSRAEYLWRHCRLLTGTVRSEEYLDGGYSVLRFRQEIGLLQGKLMRRLRRQYRPMKVAFWTSLEPQGVGNGFKLHFHMLLWNVPDDGYVWHGPSSSRRLGGDVTWDEWLLELVAPEPGMEPSLALLMLGTRFWGVSDCQRIADLDGSLRYVVKELSTSDIGVEVTTTFLNWVFEDEFVGRRVRLMRYSKEFQGVLEEDPDLQGQENFWSKVPIHNKPVVVPLVSKVGLQLSAQMEAEEQPRLTAAEVHELRVATAREGVAWLVSRTTLEIERYLQMARAEARAYNRFLVKRERHLRSYWMLNRRGVRALEGKLPSGVMQLRAEYVRFREEARAYRDWLGMTPWVSYKRGMLQAYVVGGAAWMNV